MEQGSWGSVGGDSNNMASSSSSSSSPSSSSSLGRLDVGGAHQEQQEKEQEQEQQQQQLGPRLARPQDWESHRDTIKRLYWEDDLPLRTVMDIMERRYQFRASVKTYKHRFKQWGWRKNISARETDELLRRQSPGSAHAHAHTGKEPAVQPQGHLQLQARRRHTQAIVLADDVAQIHPCFIPMRLVSPAPLRNPEACLRHSGRYVAGAVDMGLWARFLADPAASFARNTEVRGWMTEWGSGLTMLKAEPDRTAEAWRIMRRCFARYDHLIESEDPRFFIAVLYVGACMAYVHPDMIKPFMRYSADMYTAKHGRGHPCSQLLLSVSRLSAAEFGLSMRNLFDGYVGAIESQISSFPSSDDSSPSSSSSNHSKAFFNSLGGLISTLTLMLSGVLSDMGRQRGLARLARLAEEREREVSALAGWESKFHLVTLLRVDGQVEKARGLLDGVLDEPGLAAEGFLFCFANQLLMNLARDREDDAEVREAGWRMVRFYRGGLRVEVGGGGDVSSDGSEDDEVTRGEVAARRSEMLSMLIPCFNEFDGYLRSAGELEASAEVKGAMDDAVDDMCGRVGELRIS